MDAVNNRIKWTVRRATQFDPIRRALFRYYDRKSRRLSLVHPFDTHHGVDTSGALHGTVLGLGRGSDPLANNGYLGSQPSIIRAALSAIPDQGDAAFVDIGCGKGRALIVAGEFPFRSVVGIEISPELARIAEQNAKTVAREHPQRTEIAVITGDALDIAHLPDGNLVIYLYNTFGRNLIERLLRNVEQLIGRDGRTIFVVYYNPVWGQVFDGSSLLRRVFAENLPYDVSEIGYGPDSMDAVVIWQDARSAPADVPVDAERRIVVSTSGWHAELAQDG